MVPSPYAATSKRPSPLMVTAQTVGRRLLDRDRRATTAFLAGWAIETAIGVIPYVSGAVYAAAAVFGLGATTVAVWRARGPRRDARPGGKHRAGGAAAIKTDTSSAATAAAMNETGSREAPGL